MNTGSPSLSLIPTLPCSLCLDWAIVHGPQPPCLPAGTGVVPDGRKLD